MVSKNLSVRLLRQFVSEAVHRGSSISEAVHRGSPLVRQPISKAVHKGSPLARQSIEAVGLPDCLANISRNSDAPMLWSLNSAI